MEEKSGLKFNLVKKGALCLCIIVAGAGLMVLMAAMKTPAMEKEIAEKALKVEIIKVEKEDVGLTVSGYGEVVALNTLAVSPEVSGVITSVHPRLEEGETIPRGEVLFTIDADDYRTELETYTIRHRALTGNLKLAEKEYLRVKKLYTKNNTGTLADVEAAERSWNTAGDNLAQVEKLLKDTRKNLERTTVTAPFDARIKRVDLEKGQFVTAGAGVLTIADDSLLEVVVPVEAGDALMVVDFESDADADATGLWFKKVKAAPSRVVWSESGKRITATGSLHRVVRYDATNRMVYLAVRIGNTAGEETVTNGFPIVDGMFCQVIISGKTLTDVVRVPDHAVSYDGKVRLASNGRLETVPVTVLWKENGYTLVASGLNRGDQLITTRLSSPLENSLLDVVEPEKLAGR